MKHACSIDSAVRSSVIDLVVEPTSVSKTVFFRFSVVTKVYSTSSISLSRVLILRAFIGALAFPGDIEILVEQLDVILRDHTSLKEEFETFLVDSRLLERKREESVEVTPSYQIRPEAEEGSSSSGGVLNEKYYLVSPYDPEVAWQKKHQRCLNKKRNYLEDKYMKEDMLMGDIAAVIRFGKDALKLSEKPPLGFNRVLDWFCGGKDVPQEYKTHPKRAAICMLPMLQNTHEEMTRAKTSRVISVYNRASQKGNDK